MMSGCVSAPGFFLCLVLQLSAYLNRTGGPFGLTLAAAPRRTVLLAADKTVPQLTLH